MSYVDGDRMVVTVPDSAPLLELQQSTDPIGVQLSFDETSYKLMFEALDRVMKAKNNRLAYLRDLFYSHQKAGRFSFEPMKFPWLNPTQERAVKRGALGEGCGHRSRTSGNRKDYNPGGSHQRNPDA